MDLNMLFYRLLHWGLVSIAVLRAMSQEPLSVLPLTSARYSLHRPFTVPPAATLGHQALT